MQSMKIKPTTFFLVLTALLLGGVVLVVVQTQPPTASSDSASGQASTSAEKTPLFSFQESQVKTLSLKTQLRSLKFERDKNGKWQMTAPDKTPASDASVAFLLNLLVTGKSDRTITAPSSNQKEFGFHQPLAEVEVTLDNKQTHKLILGEYDFNRSFIYAQTDPPATPATDMKVKLVSPNFENAVSRPLADWKQPAASASPKPKASAKPDEKASPAPTASPKSQTKPKPSASSSPAPKPKE
jgi:hypothetical protein